MEVDFASNDHLMFYLLSSSCSDAPYMVSRCCHLLDGMGNYIFVLSVVTGVPKSVFLPKTDSRPSVRGKTI